MNVSFSGFEGQLNAILSDVKPENIDKQLAAFARQTLAQVIASGQASREYDLYVNNRPALSEDSVKAPGPILYVFSNWRVVVEEALQALRQGVVSKSGMYAGSFIVIAGGRAVKDYSAIPADASVMIINTRPYTRKMEVGANRTGKKHFERAKTSLNTRFRGAFSITTMFVRPSAGLHPDVPYTLKGGVPDRAAAQNSRSSAFRAGRATLARRKDTAAGQALTYPALVIDPVT